MKKIVKGEFQFPKSTHPDFTGNYDYNNNLDTESVDLDHNQKYLTSQRKQEDNSPNRGIERSPNRKKQSIPTAKSSSKKAGLLGLLQMEESPRHAKKLVQQMNQQDNSSGYFNPPQPVGHIYHSKTSREIIKGLLKTNYKDRLTANQVLEKFHSWFEMHGAMQN